jgi:hypothetical protein
MHPSRASTVLAVLLAGCHIGAKVMDYGPAGGTSRLGTSQGVVRGELLAATDSTLILFDGEGRRVVEVRYSSIKSGDVKPGGARLSGTPPSEAERTRLRRLSRFPQGISPQLLQQFLETNRVTTPVVQL